MTGKETIKELMLSKGISQSTLAKDIGKSQTHVTGYLNRGKNDMRLDLFVDMIEAMGCEVLVRDGDKEIKITFDKEGVDLDTLLSD